MNLRTSHILSERSSSVLVVIAVFLGLMVIAMETVVDIPLKLPGHRALPGAVALLVLAEAFAPIVLIAFAAAVSALLVLNGTFTVLSIAAWIAAALAIVVLNRTPLARTAVYFLLGGILFGAFRYFFSSWGFHHTPNLVRLAGHAGFGALGGLISLGIARGAAPSNKNKS